MQETVSPLRSFVRSAGSLALLNLASMGIAFFIGIMLARQLGAAGYGIYGLAMAVATLAGMAAEFGLPMLILREVSAAKAKDKWNFARGLEIWSHRVILLLSTALIGIIFATDTLTRLSSSSEFMATLSWAALLIPVVAIAKLRGLALLSIGRTVAGQLPVRVLRPAFFLLALLAAWAANYRLEATVAMAMQLGAGCLVMIIVSVAWYRFRPSGMVKAIPAYAPRQWVGACLPLGATEGLRLLQRQGAILLLGLLATSRETGLYRVADNLVLVTTLGQAVLAIAAAPHFARLHAIGEKEQLQRILSVTALAMTISTIALGLPVVFLGRNLLALLFGDEFRASYLPFAIAWLALVVSGGFGPVQAFANMAGQQKLVTVGFLISVSTNVMVSVFTIPRLGAIGAALGLLAGVCLSNAWLWRKVLMHEGLDSSVFSRSALRLLSPKQIRHYAQLIRRGQ